MGRDAELQCRCGEVRGRVTNASADTVSHVVCYCDDCQAYAHYLGRADWLDAHGGTDIVQVAPASLSFVRGNERIAGLRLTAKGLYRWYATCCKTPVGNTLSPSIPFVGIAAQAFDAAGQRCEAVFGKPTGAILGRFAVGEPPKGSRDLQPGLLFRAVRKVVGWRFGGGVWPHPFFDRASGAPSHAVSVLSPEERARLRPLCGPRPAMAVSP